MLNITLVVFDLQKIPYVHTSTNIWLMLMLERSKHQNALFRPVLHSTFLKLAFYLNRKSRILQLFHFRPFCYLLRNIQFPLLRLRCGIFIVLHFHQHRRFFSTIKVLFSQLFSYQLGRQIIQLSSTSFPCNILLVVRLLTKRTIKYS